MSALSAAEIQQDPRWLQPMQCCRGPRRCALASVSPTSDSGWQPTAYQQVSPMQSLIFINMVRHYLATPGLAYTLIPCADPGLLEAGLCLC